LRPTCARQWQRIGGLKATHRRIERRELLKGFFLRRDIRNQASMRGFDTLVP
jgi:hypothetical protein